MFVCDDDRVITRLSEGHSLGISARQFWGLFSPFADAESARNRRQKIECTCDGVNVSLTVLASKNSSTLVCVCPCVCGVRRR